MRVIGIIMTLLILPLGCGGGQLELEQQDSSVVPTQEHVALLARQGGWDLDTRISEHQLALSHTGLNLPRPITQDEVLDYGHRAWGLPKRATGKALRRAFAQLDRDVDPVQSLLWVDALGLAGEASGMPAREILWIHKHEYNRFQELGFSFEEAIATIAGVAVSEHDPVRALNLVRQSNEALLDPRVRDNLAGWNIYLQCQSGFDLLSQLDLAQRQYQHGPERDAFFHETVPVEWRSGVAAAVSARSRRVACDLVGHMRCARGITQMRLEAMPVEDGLGNDGVEYYKTQAILEIMGRAVNR